MTTGTWSFWSAPHRAGTGIGWASELAHLLGWTLSVHTARRHFARTALVTDREGARLLVDELGLPFDEVSTDLDELADVDPVWWTLGKLTAYRHMSALGDPFVHLDADVFLWQPLRPEVLAADVLAQNPEHAPVADPGSCYQPTMVHHALVLNDGWLPEEFLWYLGTKGEEALCCGVVGGRDVDLLGRYAESALRMVRDPANETAWSVLPNRVEHNLVVEQYLLSACIAAAHRDGRRVTVETVFESAAASFDEVAASAAGYTHLIGAAKHNADLLGRLELRVRRDYPEAYERCVRVAERQVML